MHVANLFSLDSRLEYLAIKISANSAMSVLRVWIVKQFAYPRIEIKRVQLYMFYTKCDILKNKRDYEFYYIHETYHDY